MDAFSPLSGKFSTKRSRNIKEILASEALLQTDKSMNWVSLRSDLETKPKFNDSVIPAWIRHSRESGNGIQRHGWYLNSKEVFVTGFPLIRGMTGE
uniref:Uncharacterized protein n=1 Tax=Candidatus Kentrum sp. UNK TaxID=2126344 RepID=A0A451AZL0_9GAMM|nr:MAG: hypothetical protein BECKUNK1418G_GA0071005_10619 [Candidatus Kentron sp. UNK]VFK71498.1 MAG: hypothetical protein BECKUNK1418H_GA0071006_106910 [Candidatus Kentron sp. UNK]